MRDYDPVKVAEKQIANVEAAEQRYVDAVQAITEHPGQKAIKKKGKMRTKWLAALDSGKWEANVGGYDLQAMKDKVKRVGGQRLTQGVRDAKPKIVEFQEQLKSYLKSTQNEIESIDDSTPAGADARQKANTDRMRRFKMIRRRR